LQRTHQNRYVAARVGTIDWYSTIDGVILYFSFIEYRFVSTFSRSISNPGRSESAIGHMPT